MGHLSLGATKKQNKTRIVQLNSLPFPFYLCFRELNWQIHSEQVICWYKCKLTTARSNAFTDSLNRWSELNWLRKLKVKEMLSLIRDWISASPDWIMYCQGMFLAVGKGSISRTVLQLSQDSHLRDCGYPSPFLFSFFLQRNVSPLE